MKRACYAGFFVTLLVFVFSSCTTAPRHPALKSAQLPDLIPLRHLVVNKETKFNYRIIFYRKLEDFLARHLGGRSAGFDLYEFAITEK